MAVLANESGMSSEGQSLKKNSSHEFNVYIDRQLQNKLIQSAEDLDKEDYESKLFKPANNMKKNGKIDPRVEDITGWFPDAKFVARRNNDGARNEPRPVKESFIHPWRDYRSRKEESFIFKHYTDIKKYIEQYRTEHGCHSVRNSSGGDLRRQAFQNSPAPPQQSVQVTVQQVQQGNSSANNSASLSYTNRKEQPGTQNGTNQTCSCSRASHIHTDAANLSHRYKFAPGHLARTNTEVRSHYGDSDNSSESGEFRSRTPTRRISSAASVRSKQTMPKSPTKISVPANPNTRPYPMQALTIQQHQQNGKPEAPSSGKPLDNLNCVAPEKQMMYVGRKEVDPIGFSLHVHNIHNLLTTNEAPLRGYALPKSSPPTPKKDTVLLKSRPEFEGLTWSEKLEVLRAVNKPPEKHKPKKPKLKFVKDEPEGVWTTEQEQLYEQRRIRHLVEQARLKGGKQFDWVYDAHMKARGVDWETGKLKVDNSASSSETSGSEEDGSGQDNHQRLGKYGIFVPPRGSKHKLFSSQTMARSNTFVSQ